MSSSRCGTITGSGSSSLRLRRSIVSRSRLDEHVEVRQVVQPRAAPGSRRARLRAAPGPRSVECPSRPCRWTRLTIKPSRGHPGLGEPLGEEHRLARRLGLGRGDDQEARAGLAQELGDAAGALAEAVDDAGERAEEARQLAEHVHAGDAREDREDEPGAAAEEARGEPAGGEEHLQRAAFEEVRAGSSGRPGSPARCARAACRARSRRSRVRCAARTASSIALSSCTPDTAEESSR